MANGILDDAEPDFNLPKSVADFVWSTKADSDQCIKSPVTKSTTTTRYSECFSPEPNELLFGGISAQPLKGHPEPKDCTSVEPSPEPSLFSLPAPDHPDKNIAQDATNIQTPKLLNAQTLFAFGVSVQNHYIFYHLGTILIRFSAHIYALIICCFLKSI